MGTGLKLSTRDLHCPAVLRVTPPQGIGVLRMRVGSRLDRAVTVEQFP